MTLFVVLTLLAIWRLARLFTVDELTRPLREKVAGRNPDGLLAYWVTCPWCLSMWAGWLVAVPSVLVLGVEPFWWDGAWLVVLLVLAGSLVSGMGQAVEDRLDG